MAQQRIGVVVTAGDSNVALKSVEDLEIRGIAAAWMTSGSTGGGDSIGVFTAAGPNTKNIMFGTAITQTFPRHPIAVAQQVLTLAQLAPGRFRLGLGTSGQGGVEQMLGINFRAPLAHLREYVHILKTLLQAGSVDYSGRYYEAHTSMPAVDVPVMAAALGVGAFEICGAESDGAISWVCPGAYLRDVALPAMQRGAEQANRPIPPLIAHVPVCVHDDPGGSPRGHRNTIRGLCQGALLPEHVQQCRFSRGSRGGLESWDGGRRRGVRNRGAGGGRAERTAGNGRDRGHGLTGGRRTGPGGFARSYHDTPGPSFPVSIRVEQYRRTSLGPPTYQVWRTTEDG